MNGPVLLRTFLVFFVGGWLTAAAFFSFVLGGGIIWMDCFHDNPGHVCGDALMFAAITPFYGIVLGMFVGFLPLVVGAVLAVLGRAVLRHVPLWYAIAILPACVLAYVVQGSPWVPADDMHPLPDRLLMFSGLQAAALLICWRLERHNDRVRRVILKE
jgi:hypothetical protein